MERSSVLSAASVAIALLWFVGASTAQERRLSSPQADPAGLEKRIAELERQVASVLKELRELRRELAGQPPVTAVPMKSLVADEAVKILTELVGADAEGIKIEADMRWNNVMIRADAARVAQFKKILRLIDVPRAVLVTELDRARPN